MFHVRRVFFAAAAALSLVVACVASGTAVAATAPAVAVAPAAPAAAASGPTQHVIVLLRNQHADIPAAHATVGKRVAATAADQSRLVKSVRASGGSAIRQLHVVNAFAATASPAEQAALRSDPTVAEVIPDRTVQLSPAAKSRSSSSLKGAVSSKTCPKNPAKPLLEPEALRLTNTASNNLSTPTAQKIATGKGVRVAFLADGLDVNNPDFIRPDGSHVFMDYQDFSGDGPLAPTSAAEAFGDASSIAAQGRQIYDLSTYVNAAHPLPAGCNIRVLGMAPGASLVGLKVFPAGGFAFNSAILAALDYAVTVDKVDVVNESFGSNQYPDTTEDPTAIFNEQLVAAGITVVASTGDAGNTNTIGSPASTPGVIAVGATTSFQTYAQTTGAGFQLSNGKYASDNISALSSGGVTQPGRTVDLVAPGDLGWALCTPNPDVWLDCADNNGNPSQIQEFGGTSQASPFVAGAAALVIQAYRDSHQRVSPAPALVRQLLTSTATDLKLPSSEQGAGLLNTLRAVQAARSAPGTTVAKVGVNLLISPNQIDLSLPSGTGATRSVKVTNVGTSPQVLHPSVRSDGRLLQQKSYTVTLSPLTDPSFVDSFGTKRAYQIQTFKVPAGATRLTAALAWPNSTKLARVFLLDPSGTYSAYSLPQGLGNYAFVDVRTPKAGTWRAYVLTAASAAGYAGPVELTTATYGAQKVGSVTPSAAILFPGQSRTFHVRVPAGDAGDAADALQFDGTGGQTAGAVPIVVRTLVATGPKGGTFAGAFTGGNGRAGIPGPSETYAFDVPKGRPDLAVSLIVRGDPNQAVYGFLVDPNGEPVNEQTNQTVAADGSVSLRSSLQFDHLAPQAGRWHFVFAVFGPIAGTSTSTAYTGQVRYGLSAVSASGLPNSASVKLKAGVPVTAKVTVLNKGATTALFFADGRLAAKADVTLVGTNTSGYQLAPAPVDPFPAFQLPTETDSFNVKAASDRPINFEVSPFPADHVVDLSFEGDPDVEAGPSGLTPSVTVADPIIAAQTWLALPSQIGPFPTTAPTATVSFTATAHTRPFDDAVSSSTGDPLLASVISPAPPATPLAVSPGTSGHILVTVIPTGAARTVVKGVLYVDTIDPVTGSSDEVAAIPYTYTIG